MIEEFSGLKAAKKERLYLLVEECSEVIKEATKILRFGYESYHPDKPEETNLALLQKEIGDLDAVIWLMSRNGDIDRDIISAAACLKYRKFVRSPFVKQEHKF